MSAFFLLQYAGEVQQYEAFKRWGARVRQTPPPKRDPLAPPRKGRSSSGKGGGKGGDQAALVTAIRCGASMCCLAGAYAYLCASCDKQAMIPVRLTRYWQDTCTFQHIASLPTQTFAPLPTLSSMPQDHARPAAPAASWPR